LINIDDDVESIANSLESEILEINIETDIPNFHEVVEP